MFDVSLRTQKIIVFIPWLNMLILLIFGMRTKKYGLTLKEQLLGGACMLGAFAVFATIMLMVDAWVPQAENITPFLFQYLGPFLVGWALIGCQKKIGLDF